MVISKDWLQSASTYQNTITVNQISLLLLSKKTIAKKIHKINNFEKQL